MTNVSELIGMLEMKAIIVIKTFEMERYEIACDDLQRQIKEANWPMPIFCHLLASDYEEIEVVWLDQDYDLKKFIEGIKATFGND